MKVKIILSVCIALTLAACKKDNSITEPPPHDDDPFFAQLGKVIHHNDFGYGGFRPFRWGKNSDEFFVTASGELLRIDIAMRTSEVIEDSVYLVTGKTNENSGIIFLGTRNNQQGYYVYHFGAISIETIIGIPDNQGTAIDIARNNIFYYESPPSIPNPPCTGYCWPLPGPFVPATFYHLDKQTQQRTDLENKRFMLFSTDGSKTILASQMESRMYVFDNTTRTIVDSSNMNSEFAPAYGLFYNNGVLHSFEADYTNLTIKNFNTGQVIQQYQLNNILVGDIQVSADGTKLYYSGGILNGNALKIVIYDISTNTEKTIAEVPFLQGGGVPFEYFLLSDDNKKIITKAGNDIYLKELD